MRTEEQIRHAIATREQQLSFCTRWVGHPEYDKLNSLIMHGQIEILKWVLDENPTFSL